MDEPIKNSGALYIRAAQLRARYGNMPASTLYWRLKRGLLPQPEYPFGPRTPYWAVSAIEEWERRSAAKVIA
jgi:predicted DNA-binding transcriptional regulator AlpA